MLPVHLCADQADVSSNDFHDRLSEYKISAVSEKIAPTAAISSYADSAVTNTLVVS